MKSKIILTGAAALLVSTVSANALEYRPFVGASMGLQGAIYSDEGQDIEHVNHVDLPTDFFVFGIEGGVRAGEYNQIYNSGLTINATKSTYSKAQDKYTDELFANLDMFNVSATYDNYIRISGDKSSRIDLVLGAGLGAMALHVNPADGDSFTKWSFAPEFKVGMDFELTHNITLSVNARAIVPTRSEYEMDMPYIVGGAVKYIF